MTCHHHRPRQVTIIGKHFNDVYFEFREKAQQEKAKEEQEKARTAAGAAPFLMPQAAQEQQAGKGGALIREEVLTAAIQRQLSVLSLAGPAHAAASSVSATADAVASSKPQVADEGNGSVPAPPAAPAAPAGAAAAPAAPPQQQGLRQRTALTSLIREQLTQMVRLGLAASIE